MKTLCKVVILAGIVCYIDTLTQDIQGLYIGLVLIFAFIADCAIDIFKQ